MSKKIILTGGSGFVGKLLLKKLKKYGYDVINVDSSEGYNMTDWNEIKSLKDFYLIIHLAAKSYVPD